MRFRWLFALCTFGVLSGVAPSWASAADEFSEMSFATFESHLPPLHGIVASFGRQHSFGVFARGTLNSTPVGAHLQISPEQFDQIHRERLRLEAEKPQSAVQDGGFDADGYSTPRDATHEQALANVLSPDQRLRAFEALLVFEGATALMCEPLTPAEFELKAAQRTAIAAHERAYFKIVMQRSYIRDNFVYLGEGGDSRRDEKRSLCRALDRAIWNELSADQQALLVRTAIRASAAILPKQSSASPPEE